METKYNKLIEKIFEIIENEEKIEYIKDVILSGSKTRLLFLTKKNNLKNYDHLLGKIEENFHNMNNPEKFFKASFDGSVLIVNISQPILYYFTKNFTKLDNKLSLLPTDLTSNLENSSIGSLFYLINQIPSFKKELLNKIKTSNVLYEEEIKFLEKKIESAAKNDFINFRRRIDQKLNKKIITEELKVDLHKNLNLDEEEYILGSLYISQPYIDDPHYIFTRGIVTLNKDEYNKINNVIKEFSGCHDLDAENNIQRIISNAYKENVSSNDLISLMDLILKDYENFSKYDFKEFNSLMLKSYKKKNKDMIIDFLESSSRVKKNNANEKRAHIEEWRKKFPEFLNKKHSISLQNGNPQLEKILNYTLEDNLWLLGYSEDSKVIKLKDLVNVSNGPWKPDLLVRRKDGIIDIYELKLANEFIIKWDSGHKSYYISSGVNKAIAQQENQMQWLLTNQKGKFLTKNDKLYLVIGNYKNELRREISDSELKHFSNDLAKIKKARIEAIQLLRNAFKNSHIIFYDELG